jgi:hypothetical protein
VGGGGGGGCPTYLRRDQRREKKDPLCPPSCPQKRRAFLQPSRLLSVFVQLSQPPKQRSSIAPLWRNTSHEKQDRKAKAPNGRVFPKRCERARKTTELSVVQGENQRKNDRFRCQPTNPAKIDPLPTFLVVEEDGYSNSESPGSRWTGGTSNRAPNHQITPVNQKPRASRRCSWRLS